MFTDIYRYNNNGCFHGWYGNTPHIQLVNSKEDFLKWCNTRNETKNTGRDYFNYGTVYALEYRNETKMVFFNGTCYGAMSGLDTTKVEGLEKMYAYINTTHIVGTKGIEMLREWALSEDGPWRDILPFITLHKCKNGKVSCIEANLVGCPSQLLNNFLVTMRMPDKTPSVVQDWYTLVMDGGLSKAEAFITISCLISDRTQKTWNYNYFGDHFPLSNMTKGGIDIRKFLNNKPSFNPKHTYHTKRTYAPCNSIWNVGGDAKGQLPSTFLIGINLKGTVENKYSGSFPKAKEGYERFVKANNGSNRQETFPFKELAAYLRKSFDALYEKEGIKL